MFVHLHRSCLKEFHRKCLHSILLSLVCCFVLVNYISELNQTFFFSPSSCRYGFDVLFKINICVTVGECLIIVSYRRHLPPLQFPLLLLEKCFPPIRSFSFVNELMNDSPLVQVRNWRGVVWNISTIVWVVRSRRQIHADSLLVAIFLYGSAKVWNFSQVKHRQFLLLA